MTKKLGKTPHSKPPFDPKLFLSKVGKGKTIADYSRNQVVFSQGDKADAIFYIQEGKVKITVVSSAGKEAVIGVLGPGNFLGEGCLVAQPLRMAKAHAISHCSIVRLEKVAMIRALHRQPAFFDLFLAYALSRNMRIEETLVDHLFNSSEKRLAQVLLLMANFGRDGKPEPVIGKISLETLAKTIGTTRSKVGFFMNRFRKLGFIEDSGKLHINSSLLNVVLHD